VLHLSSVTSHFAPTSTSLTNQLAPGGVSSHKPSNFALPKLWQSSIADYSVECLVSREKFGW